MRVTREDAQAVAEKLRQSPHVRGVELFGSVLKNGSGHDLDLIVFVDGNMARTWWSDEWDELRVRMDTSLQPLRRFIKTWFPWLDNVSTYSRKYRRIVRASELLELDVIKLCAEHRRGVKVDLFLLPQDCKDETALFRTIDLKNHRKTISFLEHIIPNAVRIA